VPARDNVVRIHRLRWPEQRYRRGDRELFVGDLRRLHRRASEDPGKSTSHWPPPAALLLNRVVVRSARRWSSSETNADFAALYMAVEVASWSGFLRNGAASSNAAYSRRSGAFSVSQFSEVVSLMRFTTW